MLENKYLALHIEKTAGTSLNVYISSLFTPNRVLEYNFVTNKLNREQKENRNKELTKKLFSDSIFLPFIKKVYVYINHLKGTSYSLNNLPSDFDVLTGHIGFNDALKYLSKPLTSVVMRDPLSRAISQYNHWKRLKGDVDFRIRIPYDKNTTLEQFILSSELTNWQTKTLQGHSLNEIDIVATTDTLETFPQRLCHQLKKRNIQFQVIASNTIGHYNITYSSNKFLLPENVVKRFKEINVLDYNNFALATRLSRP